MILLDTHDKIFFHLYDITKQKKCKAIIVLLDQNTAVFILYYKKTMLTSKKKKNVQFYESSNQIYISDFIGLQRAQRTQVVYYNNKAVFPWDVF